MPEDRELASVPSDCAKGLDESCNEIISGWPGVLCDPEVTEALQPAQGLSSHCGQVTCMESQTRAQPHLFGRI